MNSAFTSPFISLFRSAILLAITAVALILNSPLPAAEPLADPEPLPAGAVQIGHVDNTAEGKQSYGGTGFAVRFERPVEVPRVVAVEIYASRYGLPRPPDEDFHIYLLDENQKVLKDLPIPYARVERGQERWYRFSFEPVEVPRQFFVGLNFNAHQTKGIYVGKDTDVETSHSYTGTPESGYKPVDAQLDWMVRVYVVPDRR